MGREGSTQGSELGVRNAELSRIGEALAFD
jgi:hypothetical protein